jgi:hypothetical protein
MPYVIINKAGKHVNYYASVDKYVPTADDARHFDNMQIAFGALRLVVKSWFTMAEKLDVIDETGNVVDPYVITMGSFDERVTSFLTGGNAWSADLDNEPQTFPTSAAAFDKLRGFGSVDGAFVTNLKNGTSEPYNAPRSPMTDDEILAAAEKIKERRARRVTVSFPVEIRDRWSGQLVTQTQAFDLDATDAVQLRNDIDRQLKEFEE